MGELLEELLGGHAYGRHVAAAAHLQNGNPPPVLVGEQPHRLLPIVEAITRRPVVHVARVAKHEDGRAGEAAARDALWPIGRKGRGVVRLACAAAAAAARRLQRWTFGRQAARIVHVEPMRRRGAPAPGEAPPLTLAAEAGARLTLVRGRRRQHLLVRLLAAAGRRCLAGLSREAAFRPCYLLLMLHPVALALLIGR